MNLPFRIQSEAGSEPVISVDGAWGAPGLSLSHWPGNTTPAALKHELSTGIALAFSSLPAAEQAELSAGCVAVCNNHFDTDGLCALFAILHPAEALERKDELLAAARAGDFFQVPSEAAFIVDAIVSGVCDPARSPWREQFAGLSDTERYELCTRELLGRLAGLLDGETAEFESLWQPALDALRMDQAHLAQCAMDELVHLDACIWTTPEDAGSDIGRHALFGATDCDKILLISPARAGATFRFLLGTRSWFDLPAGTTQPRPNLAALADKLNAAEGTTAEDAHAWRHQEEKSASPELWFGAPDFEHFSSRAGDVLAPSSLDPLAVKAVVIDALRENWIFPEEEEEEELTFGA